MPSPERTLPTRLTIEPLIEAIWELRFRSNQQAVAEILTGLIYPKMRDSSDDPIVERMPVAMVPEQLREGDPSFTYAPSVRIRGKRFTVLVGQRVFTLSVGRPYCGWTSFRSKIFEMLDLIGASALIESPERFSLKYIDAITGLPRPLLSSLDMQLNVSGEAISDDAMQLRLELKRDGLLHLLSLICPADVSFQTGEKHTGAVAIDVDTIVPIPSGANFSDFVRAELDNAHSANKRLFFKLLTPETEKLLGPKYEGA